MSKLYSTVREVRAYADSLREKGITGTLLDNDIVLYVWNNDHSALGQLQQSYHTINGMTAVPVISDKGYPAVDIYKDIDESHFQFVEQIEIPVTRGYSDSDKRTDTEMSDLDVTCAINEIFQKRKGKLTPHELKKIAPPSDYGMERDEFEEMCEAVCEN